MPRSSTPAAVLSLGILASLLACSAQLTPSPPYNPPEASSGLNPSSGDNPANSQWAAVLGNSLWFYDAQRSGRLSQGTYGNRIPWRNDSSLQDGSDWGLDLTGGWYDAGDYIKATFPMGYTMFALVWPALTHGRGYELANQTAYLDGTLRWGFDWLVKADTLFVQVGSSSIDNAYWGGDQNIPLPRPAYPANSSNPGTDVFASTASVFALGSMLYTPGFTYNTSSNASTPASPSLANATYAKILLDHAKDLYNAANSTRFTTYSQSIPAIGDAYTSSTYGDDLCLAALSLALATNQSTYYADAYRWYRNFSLTGSNQPWNWDSKTPAVYTLFVEAARARPALAAGAGLAVNLTGWQAEAEGWFDRVIGGQVKGIYQTKGGLLYWDGDSDEASLQPAMAASLLLLKYAPLASSDAKSNQYTNFARGQLDYLLGNNPMSAVYLVGSHPNSPPNPHSAMASGGNNINDIRNSPATNLRVLYGAMVGGPLANDKYWTWRDDWVQNEVALDYNAAIPGLAAMMVMNSSVDPYYVNVQANTYSLPAGQPCDSALPCGHGLSGGAIAGVVLGCLGFLVILGLLIWCSRRLRKRA